MSDFKPSLEFEALVDKHVDVARGVKQVHATEWSAEDQAKAGAEWAALIAEADRLKDGYPGSPDALALARRWCEQVAKFTQGDAALGGQVRGMYQEGFADPNMANKMPFSAEVWKFIGEEAQKRLAESGVGGRRESTDTHGKKDEWSTNHTNRVMIPRKPSARSAIQMIAPAARRIVRVVRVVRGQTKNPACFTRAVRGLS